MRIDLIALLAVSALALLASPAAAQQAGVTVSIGEDLADQGDELGQRELDYLSGRLAEAVDEALIASGRYPGARVHLVIEDAQPNRPTYEQLRDRPGLSMQSLSIGGAEVSGQIVTADGQTLPLSYRWYSTDLADAATAGTWTDADRAFRRVARRLEQGLLTN